EGSFAFDIDTELTCTFNGIEHTCALQERFGRDAPSVKADATNLVFLDNSNVESELLRPECRVVASGSGTENDNIKFVLSHGRQCSLSQARQQRPGPHYSLPYIVRYRGEHGVYSIQM